MMKEQEFLAWIADRLEHVHGEDPNKDYMLRLRDMAEQGHNHDTAFCDDCHGIWDWGYDEGWHNATAEHE